MHRLNFVREWVSIRMVQRREMQVVGQNINISEGRVSRLMSGHSVYKSHTSIVDMNQRFSLRGDQFQKAPLSIYYIYLLK